MTGLSWVSLFMSQSWVCHRLNYSHYFLCTVPSFAIRSRGLPQLDSLEERVHKEKYTNVYIHSGYSVLALKGNIANRRVLIIFEKLPLGLGSLIVFCNVPLKIRKTPVYFQKAPEILRRAFLIISWILSKIAKEETKMFSWPYSRALQLLLILL